MDKPSKYHTKRFIGKWIKGADENGYSYSWNSAHEELENTSVFELNGRYYCSYCCNPAYPIQAGLRDRYRHEDYSTTGYTCICESAEKEKQFKKEKEELERKQSIEMHKLQEKYTDSLKHNKRKRLELIHSSEVKELERSEKYFDFTRK